MPVYHAIGNALLAPEDVKHGRLPAPARVGSERTSKLRGVANAVGQFTPVGPNKPLTVMIRHVYTGRFPRKSWGDSTKDMMVASALRDYATFEAAPRAVNFLRKGIRAGTSFVSPAAVEQGTSVVAYYPAVTSSSLILTLELVFDDFPDGLLEKIGGAFQSLAGIPIFAPAAGYLMLAGNVVKLAGAAGQSLFDGEPVFAPTVTLDFDVPGSVTPTADFRVVCNPSFDPSGLRFELGRGLVTSDGKPYKGDEPYMILSLDGAKRENLEKFAPTVASAALLKKFYSVRDGAEAGIDQLVDAVKLLNDARYRTEADKLKARIAALKSATDADPGEITKLEARYKGLVENILTDTLRPEAGAPPTSGAASTGRLPETLPLSGLKAPDADAVRAPDDVPEAERVKDPGHDAGAAPKGRAPAIAAAAPRPWRVARSLLELERQVNAMAPGRSRKSDGKIGDAAHATRTSDHNPWVVDGAHGVVTAMDITHDPTHGCDADAVAEAIRAARDPRVKYIIWNRRIANHEAKGGAAPWAWRPYKGRNTHEKHVHISVKSDKGNYDSMAPWPLPARAMA